MFSIFPQPITATVPSRPSPRRAIDVAGSRARQRPRLSLLLSSRARAQMRSGGGSASSSSPRPLEEARGEAVVGSGNVGGSQRYLFAVEYIGTRFSGSQWQPGCRTVVGALQDAFQQFVGKPISVVCSSRTDAGVHALSNVFHADIERTSKRRPGEVLQPYDPTTVRRAVNHFLQRNEGDIAIIDIRFVPADFHARFMAVERIYFYRLLIGVGALSLLERGLAWHIPQELNILSMQKACEVLVGSHDFSSFRGARCQARSPVKTLDELYVSEVLSPTCVASDMRGLGSLDVPQSCSISKDGLGSPDILESNSLNGLEFGQRRRHRCVVIKARARSFLYHQVRLLVGLLKSVGAGDLTPEDVERILQMRTVTAASPMAPACGLYLGHVRYNLP